MKIYKVVHNQVHETHCQELKPLLLDADGDTIYENTHFLTKAEALEEAITQCQAGVSLLTKSLIRAKETELSIKDKLANECIDLERLKTEYEKTAKRS